MLHISAEEVRVAYRKLKSFVYYDKTDLQLRLRLAEFECDPNFEKRIAAIADSLNNRDSDKNSPFSRWLNEIDFRVVPKPEEKTNKADENQGNFISNDTSQKVYRVTRVNYIFDGPIELHLIAVLWIMHEGHYLDSNLGPECYGSRLEPGIGGTKESSTRLFRKYHELYALWRDSGIRKAKELLTTEHQSVYVLGLDIQQYYYYVQVAFDDVARSIRQSQRKSPRAGHVVNSDQAPSELLRRLQLIYSTYTAKLAPFLKTTHKDLPPQNTMLAIGLCSSAILANWYLRKFDKAVKKSVRPAFYGRYVDDIFIVIPSNDTPDSKNPVGTMLEEFLVETEILNPSKDGRYEIRSPGGLYLQQKKCILQYFDTNHSIAGLEKFKKKLEENGSDFLLLPTDENEGTLDDVAYDLLYDGSTNKFRSVKGVGENRYELAKHLAKQIMLHLLTEEKTTSAISNDLLKFFKGRNAISFHDAWERVFTFLNVSGSRTAARTLAKQLKAEISRLEFESNDAISRLLTRNLKTHLRLSRAMADALNISPDTERTSIRRKASVKFRASNLIRHHFVRLPLLNYTDYHGSLLEHDLVEHVQVDNRSLALSPRYIHFDECLLLAQSGSIELGRPQTFALANRIYEKANHRKLEGVQWLGAPEENANETL